MSRLMDRMKECRTREAEYLGEKIFVKVFSNKKWTAIIDSIDSMKKDKDLADLLATLFLDEKGIELLTSDFIMSDEFLNCSITELIRLFNEVNAGTYLKN